MAFPKHPIIDVTPLLTRRAAPPLRPKPLRSPSCRPVRQASGRWITSRCTPRSSTVAAIPFAIKAMLPLPHRV